VRVPKTTPNDRLRIQLASELNRARTVTDELFQLVRPHAVTHRPIRERHRIIFYLGHLEVFDWNMIASHAFGRESFNPAFDRLFAFGIDPVDGNTPQDSPGDWPAVQEIQRYNSLLRGGVDECLERADNALMFHVAIEHRLMHAETLAYMLHWLDYTDKISLPASVSETPEPSAKRIDIPAGDATLGFTPDLQSPFGWDNEFAPAVVSVPAFSIDAHNVTNGQFLRFVEAGGYEDPSLKWLLESEGIQHPKFWRRQNNAWWYRTMFAEIPLPLSWPVYVSHAEATAYARWAGRSLPSEGQFHRAAYGTPEGQERIFPWGNSSPTPERGNFDLGRWNPVPVGSHSAGDSAFGVSDLVGNGWEWTSSVFAPLPGFKPFPFYAGYSADFFDGRHYVLKGASPRTASAFLRRSFRNWFQPHYSNIYATFRCVDN
jgi:ergothioneine biosynthesis protein EgtB